MLTEYLGSILPFQRKAVEIAEKRQRDPTADPTATRDSMCIFVSYAIDTYRCMSVYAYVCMCPCTSAASSTFRPP